TGTRSSAPERMYTSDSSASRYCGSPLSVLRLMAGKDKKPPATRGAFTCPGIVGEGKLGTESRATGAGRNGNGHGAGSSHRIGGEFLANASDCSATFRERDRWNLRCSHVAAGFLRIDVLRVLHERCLPPRQ